jgi:mono/diheme cytochrome c family protein
MKTMRRSERDVERAKPGKSLAAALGSILLLAGIPVAGGQEASKGLIWKGVFTEMQARRGEAAYQGNCAACHGRTLQATNPDAPNLTGPSFGISWNGKPVADLFTLMRTSMPLGAPGSLSDPEYLDIVAYILKFNGYPAGDRELGPEDQLLKQIVIEPKK